MNECGACGRRWVEPRLLPCLHTVCTPCLHARATHTTTSTTTPTTTTTTTTSNTLIRRESSRETPTHTPTPTSLPHVPIRTSTPTTSYPPQLPMRTPTPTSIPSTTTRSTTPTPSVCSSTSSSSTLQQNGHHHHHHPHHAVVNGDNTRGTSPMRPRLYSEGDTTGREDQRHHRSWPPSHDLDTVIDMLTNLSPGSRANTPSTPAPRLTLTPSESPAPPSDATPTATLERPSRWRGDSCESVQKGRGVYVVWCPECGYEAEVPPGGVECFPLNYILQKHLVLEALNSDSTTVYCDLCQDEVEAEERCETCPANLCRLCGTAHIRQRRTTHHVVISLQEARAAGIREVAHTLVCSTHGEGEVGWWCQSCQEPLCASCLATLHRGHPNATVAHEAPQARAILTSLLERATARVDELLGAVEELAGAGAEVEERGRLVGDEVNSFIDDYILALEHHRTTLLHQVRQACERAQRGMVVESQRAGQTASWLRQGCDLAHDLLHHAGNAEALALTPLISARIQSLLREEVRGPGRWCRLTLLRDHRAGRVRGHRLEGVIADERASPAQSRLKPLCEVGSVSVGSRVSALVVARDDDGQPITHGGEQPVATLTSLSGAHLCGCSVRDREDGSYEVVLSPPVPGPALLTVTIQGVHVKGSPLELTVTPSPPSSASSSVSSSSSSSSGGGGSGGDQNKECVGRRHTGIFHCCTFCSSSGDKTATCACSATMPGGYQGCGHNHAGHPGQKHWSCCAQTSPSAPCARPSSQYYQVTL
ncbi:hypothetical protein Pmani_025320 [Petrolisthes manimaculis]|uniref:B box-type domain-containing protein n=1 Tax=Petrolisthes manimaculis TaxID=1843537 RepID=A0AAE1TYH9_9EUCA|nr:hypothetical protein Pmani_025320 [Petrolisthes manimaculis]